MLERGKTSVNDFNSALDNYFNSDLVVALDNLWLHFPGKETQVQNSCILPKVPHPNPD